MHYPSMTHTANSGTYYSQLELQEKKNRARKRQASQEDRHSLQFVLVADGEFHRPSYSVVTDRAVVQEEPYRWSTQMPGKPKALAKASTSFLTSSTSLHTFNPASKSLSFLPFSFWICSAIWQQRSKKPAIFSKSALVQPRVVMAGVPMRTPPGESADASPWTAFRFSEIDAASHTFSTLEPVRPCGRRSHRTKWLSVPSLASLWPLAISAAAKDLQLAPM